jgi:hypothetical protein
MAKPVAVMPALSIVMAEVPEFIAVTVRILLLPAVTVPKSRLVLAKTSTLGCGGVAWLRARHPVKKGRLARIKIRKAPLRRTRQMNEIAIDTFFSIGVMEPSRECPWAFAWRNGSCCQCHVPGARITDAPCAWEKFP